MHRQVAHLWIPAFAGMTIQNGFSALLTVVHTKHSMNEKNTNMLFGRYPRLYQNRHVYRISSVFDCEDGWFRLIDRLSAEIEALCDRLKRENGMPVINA
jgi:hypothetical protein